MNTQPELSSRADWMCGKHGLMVHWVFSEPGSVDETVDAFDLDGFLADFDRTGSDWLIFPIGHFLGTYASPSATLDALDGPEHPMAGHCSKRDLIGELAAAMHARGKRFVAYLPSEVQGTSVEAATHWNREDPDHREFQTIWCNAIREWALRWGKNLDGWWLDGYYGPQTAKPTWPNGIDEDAWEAAVRAGNPDCAVALNPGWIEVKHEPKWYIFGLEPRAKKLHDYLAGEVNFIKDGKVYVSPWEETYWLPEGKYVPGTTVVNHVLFPIDGWWGLYWPWATNLRAPFTDTRPEMFDKEALSAMEARGEFPAPIVDREGLQSFLRNFTAAGGGCTVNVGITRTGRLNPKSVALF